MRCLVSGDGVVGVRDGGGSRVVVAALPTLLTCREAAGVLRISYHEAVGWCRSGRMPGVLPVKVGREYRVDAAALAAFLYGSAERAVSAVLEQVAAQGAVLGGRDEAPTGG